MFEYSSFYYLHVNKLSYQSNLSYKQIPRHITILHLQLLRNSRRYDPQQINFSTSHHTNFQPPNRSPFAASCQLENSCVNNNNNIGCHGHHQTRDLSAPPPSYQEVRDVEKQTPPPYESLFPNLDCRVDVTIEISDVLEWNLYPSPPSYKDYILNLSKTEVWTFENNWHQDSSLCSKLNILFYCFNIVI